MSYGYEGGAVCGAASMAKPVTPSRPVNDAFDRLRKSVSILDATVGVLADRLDPVLGPDHPEKEGNATGEIRGRACDIAESALSESEKINYIAGRVDRLLSRLQV